ncbi:MAG TPA: helix-turn-helix domain-containing protein, partial [Planctomycetes bacterium]|nr:helix-turn-helix domain-containing protein [Planctomycetota bacterium]
MGGRISPVHTPLPVCIPHGLVVSAFPTTMTTAFCASQAAKWPCAIRRQDWDCSKSGKAGQWELVGITGTLNARFAGGIPMDGTIPGIPRKERRRMAKRCTKCKDARLKTRYLITLNLAEGRSVADTARALKVNRSTVYRVAARFRE